MPIRPTDPPHGIVPPHVLRRLVVHGDAAHRAAALETLLATERLRAGRAAALPPAELIPPPPGKHRTVYDAAHGQRLPGKVVRLEEGAPPPDAAVNEAFDGLGATYDFYRAVLGRDSIDGRG